VRADIGKITQGRVSQLTNKDKKQPRSITRIYFTKSIFHLHPSLPTRAKMKIREARRSASITLRQSFLLPAIKTAEAIAVGAL
jgi:hypothetical protein